MKFLLIAAAIFGLDFKLKNYMEEHWEFGKKKEICNGNIIVTKTHNTGAMLNFMESRSQVVRNVSVGLFIILFILFLKKLFQKGDSLSKMAFAFLVGGASSNVYDRLKRGFVVDYFSFLWLKKVVFNLGDIFIFLGSLLLII